VEDIILSHAPLASCSHTLAISLWHNYLVIISAYAEALHSNRTEWLIIMGSAVRGTRLVSATNQ